MAEKKVLTEKKPAPDRTTVAGLYAPLAKQHELPTYEALNADFDVDTIDPGTKHLLKEISKKIFERVDVFKKILETLLQPDVSLLSMMEAEFLSDADHERIADILRRLMRLDRTLLLAELENAETLYADFITEAAKEWPQIKKELAPIIQHMQRGWTTRNKMKTFQHYLG